MKEHHFVKDFADGFIHFDNEAEAVAETRDTGALRLVAYSVEDAAVIRAMHSALERLDPSLIPGLTAAERSALSRYARPAADGPRRVRHVKTGGKYTVLGDGEVQLSVWHDTVFKQPFRRLFEGDELTVYQGADGKLWLRFPDEFNDGRFEDLNNAEHTSPPEA